MRIKTEAKIGLIVAATLLLVYWGINYLKGRNVLKRTDVYYTVFQDIKGLDISAPVILNGYKVGLVTDIDFAKKSLENIVVSFAVEQNIKLPKGSLVELTSTDALGSKALNLNISNNSAFFQYGDTLKSAYVPDLMSTISKEIGLLDSTIREIKKTITSVNLFLDENTINDLKYTVEKLKSSSNLIENQLKGGDLSKSFNQLELFISNLNANSEKINSIFANLENVTDSLAKANISRMIETTNESLSQANLLLSGINEGKGSLGLLATNDSLFINVNKSIESLDILLKDLNQNPHRYVRFSVFGGKDKKE